MTGGRRAGDPADRRCGRRAVAATGHALAADGRDFGHRHVPDPVHVETVLLPLIERLRVAKARGEPNLEAR